MLLPVFSLLDVELVLEAGDDKFCDATDEEFGGFACGEVLTERGDVNPELFELIVLLFVA